MAVNGLALQYAKTSAAIVLTLYEFFKIDVTHVYIYIYIYIYIYMMQHIWFITLS